MAKRPTTKKPPVRDRVVALDRVRADSLRDHPHNWRKHPKDQQAVMGALYGEVGYVKPADVYVAKEGDALVVSGKLKAGDRVLMDGHLRAATLPPDYMIPINITDLTEAEALKYLLTCDPLAGLAEQDDAAILELAALVDSDSADVQKMIADLVKLDDEAAGAGDDDVPGDGGKFQVLITCKDENEQRDLLGELLSRGIDCKSFIA